MTEVTIEKTDQWININSSNLDFFGQFFTSAGSKFTVAFSDGHFVTEGSTKRWIDGKVILLRESNVAWIKDIPRPNEVKVTSNGTVAVNDLEFKKDNRLGGTFLVFDSKGDNIFKRKFDSNLNDCNITKDAKMCFVSTLAPDNTLYAMETISGRLLWTLKDKHASTGKIELDDDRQVVKIMEKFGLGVLRMLDFSGNSVADESEESLRKLQRVGCDQGSIEQIAALLTSSNQAIVLNTLKKLKTMRFGRKVNINVKLLLPLLQRLYDSNNDKLSHLAFDNLLKLYKSKLASKKETIDYLIHSLDNRVLDENVLFLLTRLAQIDTESMIDIIPKVHECLESSQKWNEKRFAAFFIGQIGKERPDLVKDVVPLLIQYIANPEATKEQPTQLKIKDATITIETTGINAGTWLKDACIDAIGDIGGADQKLVSDAISLLQKIASSDSSEYSRKKAQKALKLISRAP